MIAEIVSVGTELLLGQTIDTDAVYIAQTLSRIGISIFFRTTVGDNEERIKESLTLAFSRAELVITIGGLGPTQDDITKEMVADVLGDTFREDEEHTRWLRDAAARRGQEKLPASFMKQALVPKSGSGIPNPNGTALGAIFEKDGKLAICLPGPPNELIPMMEQSVEPFLRQKTSGEISVIHSRTLRIVGMGESLVEDKIRDLLQTVSPTVAPYAKLGEVHLRLTVRAASIAEAEILIAPCQAEIRARLGSVVYGADDETLESVVVTLLQAQNRRLAVAESCSGGLICKRLTDVPDASRCFDLGIVAYSNDAKIRFLDVPPALLDEFGAVSSEVARAMAKGARQAGDADLAVSVTGIAGPGGGSEAKPVGTVQVGLAWNDGVFSEHHHFLGRRADVAYRSSQAALALVRRFLLDPNAAEFSS